MLDVDTVATFMISIVTHYFSSCGDSLEVLLEETNHGGTRPTTTRKPQDSSTNRYSSDQATLCSTGDVNPHQRQRRQQQPFEIQKMSGTDLIFFPRPSYETPMPFQVRNLPPLRKTTAIRKEVIVPPPEVVASRWIAMGGTGKENRVNEAVPSQQLLQLQLQQYPFDEVKMENAKFGKPPLGTRQSRFHFDASKSNMDAPKHLRVGVIQYSQYSHKYCGIDDYHLQLPKTRTKTTPSTNLTSRAAIANLSPGNKYNRGIGKLYSSPQEERHHNICTMASQWKSAVDPTTGQTYYFHEVTRETQWRKPMELASDEEKSAMEQKVQKEKDFFAAMEANILSSLSRGVIPGTPSPERPSPKKMEKLQSFRRPSLMRPNDVLPELVRTISTMDETVLRDVIRRQPSIRNIKKGISRREPSLQMDDLRSFSTNTDRSSNGFESWGNSSEFSQYSYQGNLETLKEDAREALAIELDTKIDLQGRGLPNLISGDNTSESLRRGSKPGDPDWKETQALTRLCSLTQEMMNADDDEAKPSKSSPGGRLKKASEGDIGRALPREMDFEDSDFEEEEKPAPLRRKDRAARLVANSDKTAADLVRPTIQRRNTCGTMYIRTTMSAPDKDATIRCVCGVYRSHILSSEHDNLPIDETTAFTVFNDYPEGAMKRQNHGVPSLDEVTTFYRDVFFKAQMEADCVIMSLIYVERLIKKTIGKLRPRANNWRSLLFSCMILSSKVWDDLSMWNGDFSQSCPPGGVNFCLQRTNQLELAILNTLKFNVKVPASEYAKYYFLLRSMLIKSGLGGEDLGSLNPLDVEGARRLQQVSSQFESRSLAKPAALSNFQRSKSLSVHSNRDATPLKHPKTKLGLEQVVKMS